VPTSSAYRHATDYERVGAFLTRTYRTAGDHVNWLQPRWEYMHFHPLVRDVGLHAIGVWESDTQIVGVVHPEHFLGRAYFELDPEHGDLRGEMLAHAEEHLAVAAGEQRELALFVNDADVRLRRLAADRGYVKTERHEVMTRLPLAQPLPEPSLPEGFRLQSLADDNDLWKVHGVLWRGFDHGDDPPAEELGDREFMQSAPNFDRDLNVVVVAPDGEYVSYCGMWFEPVNRFAYVEPVATDPRYRRLGLGREAVREGLRRCAARGATVAYVGSDIPIYARLGFRPMYRCSVWRRRWSA
jgi:predicted N-acetyltransferase YhbS